MKGVKETPAALLYGACAALCCAHHYEGDAVALEIALLHPGDMGSAVGGALVAKGLRVWCALEGRSQATRERAARAGLTDAGTLPAAVGKATGVLSICPPHAALNVANAVAQARFRGLFVDANAVSPDTVRAVGSAVEAAGARLVD